MRVLVAFEFLGPVGGAQRSVLELAEGLSRRGHDFVVAYRVPDSFQSRWEAISSELVEVPLWNSTNSRARNIVDSVRGAHRIGHVKVDVIYCNFFSLLPFSLMAAWRTKVPVVMSIREPVVNDFRRNFHRAMLKGTAATVFISDRQRADYKQAGMDRANSIVIRTGLDTTVYRPPTEAEREQARDALGIATGQVLVLYLGRIDPAKGIETLMEAVSRASDPRIAVLVAGAPSTWRRDGEEYLNRLKSTAPPAVRFIGRRDDVRTLLWAADVVVAPSVWEEPLGRVPLEAMACGVPVVASRVGGFPEVLRGDLSQLLFRPGDAEDLVSALRRALSQLGSGRSWSDEARANIVQNFDLTRAVDSLESVLLGAAGPKIEN
jgi:glycosyltransferase involved in cell wall biosynthesis